MHRLNLLHRTQGRHITGLHLLLVVALAFAPLWSPAQASPGTGTVPGESVMPCHFGVGEVAAGQDDRACPHCCDASAASSCQCCGQIAPAGLCSLRPLTSAPASGAAATLTVRADRLPEAMNEGVFRPPKILI